MKINLKKKKDSGHKGPFRVTLPIFIYCLPNTLLILQHNL